ncbi:hypothetical protein ACFSTC_12770 [Nonomuraea ferruginea]
MVYAFAALCAGVARPHDQLERVQRRRQQRRPVDRAGRHPGRGDRRHVAGRAAGSRSAAR